MAQRTYTEEEDAFIIRYYGTMKQKDIAKHLGRSANSVSSRSIKILGYKNSIPVSTAGAPISTKASSILFANQKQADRMQRFLNWMEESGIGRNRNSYVLSKHHSGQTKFKHSPLLDRILAEEDDGPLPDLEFPKNRRECVDGPRPCPWIRCRYHLWSSISEVGGINTNYDVAPWEMPETCVLDIAGDGPLTLDAVGVYLGVCRERVRQIQNSALSKIEELRGWIS